MFPDAQNAYNEALNRIGACLRQGKQGTHLDLASLGLTRLPPEIGELVYLTSLQLFNNQLSTLPLEFEKLGALQHLDLNRNQLTAFPLPIYKLRSLNQLYIPSNQLTSLPPEIGQLLALRELRLGNNQLASLPPEIGQLSALKELDLTSNHLRTLPPEIGQLSTLTILVLSTNRLRALPPEIGQLSALRELRLINNKLTRLPPEIGQLSALRELRLINNKLTRLPPEIGRLSSLTLLVLSYNQLASLPPEIGRLASLTRLYLPHNQLTNLPREIGALKDLELLNIGDSKFAQLPDCLKSCGKLEKLGINSSKLTSLPTWLKELKSLTHLLLWNNKALNIPPEVLGEDDETWGEPNAQRVLDYYFAHRKAAEEEGTDPLMEAKVLVLGEASVGKSCLIAALTQGKRRCDVPDTGTRGIVRQMWEVSVKAGEMSEKKTGAGVETLRLNCWDFGGQEIYHSAHTLFLTKRAVYLIVLSKRDNERQNNVDYWLRMAASFGGLDAVIYVVVNKCDEPVGYPPDLTALRLRHPQLRGFLETSCDDLRGIPEARKTIVREALRLDGVRQPVARTWLEIKKKLEKMPEHTLSMCDWAKLCGQAVSSEEGQRELLHMCDRLGTVRYFPTTKDKLVEAQETAILNPEWVTLGIYALLDDEELKKRGGMLDREQMTAILKAHNYPPEHERIIEEVMRRFDLLYDSADHGEKHRMLIPLMMNELMPSFSWPEAGTLEFRFQYQVMPAGLLPAFMARRHLDLSKNVPAWKHGCVLSLKQCQARVIADTEQKRVLVSVHGPEASRREALDEVRFTFSALHGVIDKLAVEELIPVPKRPDAPMLKYNHMRALHWKGIGEYEAEGTEPGETITVNVREALDGVRGQAQRQRDDAEYARTQERGKYIIYGDYNEGNKQMNIDDHSINARDISNSQVGQTLTNCQNMIQQQAPGELKSLLEKLEEEVKLLLPKLPEDKQEEAAGNLELLTKAVTGTKPNRAWYSVSSEGLLEASKFVKDFTGNIAGPVASLGKLVGLA
ncbi:MAG: small GTP-binding protein [Verrucomicrobiaceae bacterium]|nr:small GTP-binding protein [Verrucomicrobiaceae bacterium]